MHCSPPIDRGKNGKLWTKEQFPEGCKGAFLWDLENIKAAQEWCCPCKDRFNCIGKDRMGILDLVFYRKDWQLSVAPNEGGQRDSSRKELASHFDAQSNSFTRSFVVGDRGDCCAASAGLAKGMSFAHWAASRADVRKPDRPWHAGRASARAELESEQRVHLRAYIAQERETMEGTKGGSVQKDGWHTDYLPLPKRWKAYKKSRTDKGLPWFGSLTMFRQEWLASAVVEEKACGHAKCSRCMRLDGLEAKYAGRADKQKELAELRVCCPLCICVAHSNTHGALCRPLTSHRVLPTGAAQEGAPRRAYLRRHLVCARAWGGGVVDQPCPLQPSTAHTNTPVQCHGAQVGEGRAAPR